MRRATIERNLWLAATPEPSSDREIVGKVLASRGFIDMPAWIRAVDDLTGALTQARSGHATSAGTEISEDLGRALDFVVRAAGELTNAHAAAIWLAIDGVAVLAGTWGCVALPRGYRSAELSEELGAGMRNVARVQLKDVTHEIGCLWVARLATEPFEAGTEDLLMAIGGVASLAVGRMHKEGWGRETTRESSSRVAGTWVSPSSPAPAAPGVTVVVTCEAVELEDDVRQRSAAAGGPPLRGGY
jgi:hypothetical protein